MSTKQPPIEDDGYRGRSSAAFHQQLIENTVQKTDAKDEILGYFINYGTSSCRVFAILKDGKTLQQKNKIIYRVDDSDKEIFLKHIIDLTKDTIIPSIGDMDGLLVKTFADNNFKDIFGEDDDADDFLEDFMIDFYYKTKLSFNILTDEQTENNISANFREVDDDSVIINIGSNYVDVYAKPDGSSKFRLFSLPIELSEVQHFISRQNIPEIWADDGIKKIKDQIKKLVTSEIRNIKAKKAYILKDELTFMRNSGYRLRIVGSEPQISFNQYKKDNRRILFNTDYRAKLANLSEEERTIKYGYKIGHIILETLFDIMEVNCVFPSDLHSIHGNADAYIFNVVVGGSASDTKSDDMIEACNLLAKMGVEIISPLIVDNHLEEESTHTHIEHIKAIRKCDLLFISNKQEYFGEQTSNQIYLAHGLFKPIAFWKDPTKQLNEKKLEYIPHECWDNKMEVLKNL